MEGCVFRENDAGPQRTYGGAIFLEGSTATINQSTFTGNNALQGGAIWGRESHVTITDSTIAENTAGNELCGKAEEFISTAGVSPFSALQL